MPFVRPFGEWELLGDGGRGCGFFVGEFFGDLDVGVVRRRRIGLRYPFAVAELDGDERNLAEVSGRLIGGPEVAIAEDEVLQALAVRGLGVALERLRARRE